MADKKITENTLIFEALEINPNAAEILQKHGMHCLGCPSAQMETLIEACKVHEVDVNEILAAINNA